MFSTRSSVTQLRPETVVHCVNEAEEIAWNQRDLNDFFNQADSSIPTLGSLLLSQSGSITKIHNHFSQLESRKCCTYLSCKRTTVNSMRPVLTSVSIDDGSGKKIEDTSEAAYLENEELRAFKHAYLCAVYPVLAAPKPPSPASPSPVLTDSATVSMTTVSSIHHHVPHVPNDGEAAGKASAEAGRPTTPYSLHDSGVEESEEAGLIPMESICEQLQRAFRLPQSVFRHYEKMIVKSYAKKTSQKLLAEELCGQLVVLERNNHPFYSPANFITQNGYDLWQKQERAHISSLLNKFWHSSLPFPADSQDLIAELHTVHDDYLILLQKLLKYESGFRREIGERSSTSCPSLSSASCRLLLEFGLRYGIGELFQKIHYIESMSHEFDLSIGYLSFINHLVQGIQQTLPKNKASVIMVRKELSILQTSLQTLKVQTCKALTQMKSHFPSNKPAEGIDLLLKLLRTVLSLMRYLSASGTSVPAFESCLKTIMQSAFHQTYETFKMVAKNDLKETREIRNTPRLLNMLMLDIREDVTDYRNNFEGTFQKYFSISKLAAISYYQHLIDDVRNLLEGEVQHKPEGEIDLRMLALAYRLNRLEAEWKPYICQLKLTWRSLFLSSVNQWTTAMKVHMQNLVLEAVSCDKFTSKNVELSRSSLGAYQVSSNGSDHYSRSVSAMSLTPSVNSAFSSIINPSLRSTPYQNGHFNYSLDGSMCLMHESIKETGQEQADQEERETTPKVSNKSIKRISSFEGETKSLNVIEQTPETENVWHSAVHRRSLPSKLNVVAAEEEGDIFPFGNPEEISRDLSHSKFDQKDGEESQVPPSEQSSEVIEAEIKFVNTSINERESMIRVITPDDLDDDEGEEEEKDHDDSDENEKTFRFPPLRLESHSSEQDLQGSNVNNFPSSSPSQPVDGPQNMPSFILNISAPPSLSSKAPSIVEQVDGSSLRFENDFSDSMDSTISFPSPTMSQAVIPISGSAVDLLIMLQRVCNFGHNLITIMLPDISSRPNSSEGKRPSHRYFDATRRRNSDHFSMSSGPPSGEESSPGTNQKESFSFITIPSTSKSDLPQDPNTPPASSYTSSSTLNKGSESSDRESLSQTFMTTDGEQSQKMQAAFYALKLRLSLHLRLFKLTCNAVQIYTYNMLCMDLCGTSRNVARHMVGPKLLELAQTQQAEGLIWGCRHQTETDYDCLYYPNQRSRYLNGRYEAVTQNMCIRINNVYACLQFMEDFKEKLSKSMKICEENQDSSFNVFVDENLSDFDSVWQDFSVSLSNEGEAINVDRNPKNLLVVDAEKSSALMKQWVSLIHEAINSTRCHILAVLTAMCRLLAHKLNLFVRDGLPLLLYLKKENINIPTLLERITVYLQKYLDALSNWLYSECFQRTLDSLWVFMVQNFEAEAETLKSNGTAASKDAHNWLLTISHLIKFMNNNGKGIKKDLLLSQANNVIFRFQLYTLPTVHLIALFYNLKEYYFEGDRLAFEETQLNRPPSILHRIHHDLQSLRKCFSGAELVHWIVKNRHNLPADLPIPIDSNFRQSAITLCQILLDQQFILEVDFEKPEHSTSPLTMSYQEGVSPYPQLSVHSHTRSSSVSDSFLERWSHPDDDDYNDGNKFHPINDDTEDTEVEQKDSASVLSFRQTTPVETIAIEADVHAHDKNSITSLVMKSEEDRPRVSQEQPTSFSDYTSHFPRDDNNTTSCNFTSAGLPAAENLDHVRPRSHKDSVTSEDSCFMHTHTPFGSLVNVTPTGDQHFQASSSKFYFIHQNALHTSLALHDQDADSSKDFTLSKTERALARIRSSKESITLIEQCVVYKVSSLNLLTIIASRKKSDPVAKEFLNKLPLSLRNKVYSQLGSPVLDCRSS